MEGRDAACAGTLGAPAMDEIGGTKRRTRSSFMCGMADVAIATTVSSVGQSASEDGVWCVQLLASDAIVSRSSGTRKEVDRTWCNVLLAQKRRAFFRAVIVEMRRVLASHYENWTSVIWMLDEQ